MHRIHSPANPLRTVLAALLLLAMLAGQWTGLEHRVRHGGGMVPALHEVAAGSDHAQGADEGYAHSCQLFDAATLGATIHTAFFSARCERAAEDWRLSWPAGGWQPSFIAYFSSRAPPSS
ncbi:hypothetical protein [Noviherbaspirillum aridicola]|uniref:Uncharacterized protein n=1 Tax=Noviherbaspirillum aridicola TaxID=2849687 RepID=A0ABQ4Q457_9BURK|nr:hypothetical protein [Noviherbaspirillum aridicola]GIZ51944.1 hypothetical protein NCCP691_19580 [Noviherbaspirillum aridicola]